MKRDRFFRANVLKEGALSPDSVTRAQDACALFSNVQSHFKHGVDVTLVVRKARLQQVGMVQQDILHWTGSTSCLQSTWSRQLQTCKP